MVSNFKCVQFHGRVNLIHNNKIYLLKIICIFNIEIIRECCTYQNRIFESSFSFVILECIRLVCGSTVCVVVFAFLEFWLRIVLVAHIGMELLSQALFPIMQCIRLVSGICLFGILITHCIGGWSQLTAITSHCRPLMIQLCKSYNWNSSKKIGSKKIAFCWLGLGEVSWQPLQAELTTLLCEKHFDPFYTYNIQLIAFFNDLLNILMGPTTW